MFLSEIAKNEGFSIPSLGRFGKVLYHGDMATTIQYIGNKDEPYPKPCQISSMTEVETADLAVVEAIPSGTGLATESNKRKRGRPKGSKNKPKEGEGK